jgi:pyruvate/2-oxoglutarate dehydrogenase complex dihydrolipoamide acyltransferase (E2) component
MSTKITVPKIGTSMAPLALIEWKAREGDRIEKGSVVLVVESEKIRHDVEAKASGFLHILIEAENEAPIGSAAGLIASTKKELKTLQETAPAEVPKATIKTQKDTTSTKRLTRKKGEEERIRISPAARKMAEDYMIDISEVVGTGPGGVIRRGDIEKVFKAVAKAGTEEYQGRKLKKSIPLIGIRKTIAEHMHRSITQSAHVNLMGEIDMFEMVRLRESFLEQAETIGSRVSYTDLIVFVLSRMLKDHPMLNSSLVDDEIRLWESINIGVAVGYEGGLIVPVVKDADKKSVLEISNDIRTLAGKAREQSLATEEVTGGTFTLSNVGPLGVGYRFDTDIINEPESAILGTSGITDRAVVRDKQIVIRPVMTYSLTYDHRITEGFTAAKFTNDLERLMANPYILFAKIGNQ